MNSQEQEFLTRLTARERARNQHIKSSAFDQKFCKYKFPILFHGGVLKATLITFFFILTDDLQINILKFVIVHAQWGN